MFEMAGHVRFAMDASFPTEINNVNDELTIQDGITRGQVGREQREGRRVTSVVSLRRRKSSTIT